MFIFDSDVVLVHKVKNTTFQTFWIICIQIMNYDNFTNFEYDIIFKQLELLSGNLRHMFSFIKHNNITMLLKTPIKKIK